MADVLTDGAYTWYSANKHKRYLDPQSVYYYIRLQETTASPQAGSLLQALELEVKSD